ncbi:hypothetical protein BV25DRAFT_1837424 [Artomyces pyxidatus]|uniref:Uncharacterized protein n=1 Tax=Artomyces pyxidatus TaxID=48021 RepID=A0ACB8T6J3_9AGAM|nr:hypothetical protein BV25DRAFT_1837424 [Artomyces pyxidatus]
MLQGSTQRAARRCGLASAAHQVFGYVLNGINVCSGWRSRIHTFTQVVASIVNERRAAILRSTKRDRKVWRMFLLSQDLSSSENYGLESLESRPYERCPLDLEDLMSWAYFTHNRRTHELLWKPFVFAFLSRSPYDLFPGRCIEEISLRIQGFVESAILDGAGDWDGGKEQQYSAAQSLALGCGLFPDIFSYQVRAMQSICELGKKSLCPRAKKDWNDTVTKENSILFRRPVFRLGCESSMTRSALNSSADEVSLESLEEDTADERKLVFRGLSPKGRLYNGKSNMIGIGDFVEVHCFVRTMMTEADTGLPRIKLILYPTGVIKLCEAKDFRRVLRTLEEQKPSD